MAEPFLLRYMQPLLAGRRAECFGIVQGQLEAGTPAEELVCNVVWPAMLQVRRLYDDDRINLATEHMACRINRVVADQLQARLKSAPPRHRRVIVTCADTQHEELGAQMAADLLQADGWETYFLGGGVPDDELVNLIGQLRPSVLFIFGALPEAIANTRALIHRIRGIGVCPEMNILVSGGIFSRADGLWQEVGADAYAAGPADILQIAANLGPRQPNTPHVGIVKKRRRRRKDQAQLVPA